MEHARYVAGRGLGYPENYYVILPPSGDPALLCWSYGSVDVLRRDSPIHDVDRGRPDWADMIVEKMKAKSVPLDGRIGIVGIENMPALHYLELRGLLPLKAQLVPVSDMMLEIMSTADPAEIRAHEKAGAIADLFYPEFQKNIRAGMNEMDLPRICAEIAARNGGDVVLNLWDTGPNVFIAGGPENRVLAKGDMIMEELGVAVDGQEIQWTRMISIGEPAQKYKDAHAVVLEMYNRAAKEFGPEKDVAEITRKCYDEPRKQAGYDAIWPYAHSTRGRDVGLEPMFPPTYQVGGRSRPGFEYRPPKLKPGMVIVNHPSIADKGRTVGALIGNSFLITETGSRPLSKAPLGIIVV
jgi:Xaa-Pro aminopeptidase